MTLAVGRLVGRGSDNATVSAVLMRWYEHSLSLGDVGTEPGAMERELGACVTSTRNNRAFNPARSQAGHEAAAAEVVLPQDMLERMKAPIAELLADDDGEASASPEVGTGYMPGGGQETGSEDQGYEDSCYPEEDPTPDQKHQLYRGNTNESFLVCVTRDAVTVDSPGNTGKRSLMNALCETRDEGWLIESLLAMFAIERQRGPRASASTASLSFQFTHDQLRRVVSARFPEAVYPVRENMRIARLKEKFFNRIGGDGGRVPATRYEMLREVSKGQRAKGAEKGTPSGYEPTGIEAFFRATPVIPP